jgi:hypothetical protein
MSTRIVLSFLLVLGLNLCYGQYDSKRAYDDDPDKEALEREERYENGDFTSFELIRSIAGFIPGIIIAINLFINRKKLKIEEITIGIVVVIILVMFLGQPLWVFFANRILPFIFLIFLLILYFKYRNHEFFNNKPK